MKKEDLIAELQKLPDGMEVCVFDHRMNAYHATGEEEGNSEGIYPSFDVGVIEDDMLPEGAKKWAYLAIDNPDFDESTGKRETEETGRIEELELLIENSTLYHRIDIDTEIDQGVKVEYLTIHDGVIHHSWIQGPGIKNFSPRVMATHYRYLE